MIFNGIIKVIFPNYLLIYILNLEQDYVSISATFELKVREISNSSSQVLVYIKVFWWFSWTSLLQLLQCIKDANNSSMKAIELAQQVFPIQGDQSKQDISEYFAEVK